MPRETQQSKWNFCHEVPGVSGVWTAVDIGEVLAGG